MEGSTDPGPPDHEAGASRPQDTPLHVFDNQKNTNLPPPNAPLRDVLASPFTLLRTHDSSDDESERTATPPDTSTDEGHSRETSANTIESSSSEKSHHPLYQMFTTGRSTIVSAPGKVLMAGGYLVLDMKYMGLVIGTSSRFYTCITEMPLEERMQDLENVCKSSRSPRKDPPPLPKQQQKGDEETTPKPKIKKSLPPEEISPKMKPALSTQDDPHAAMITVRAGQFPRKDSMWIYRLELDELYRPPIRPFEDYPPPVEVPSISVTDSTTTPPPERQTADPNTTPPLASATIPASSPTSSPASSLASSSVSSSENDKSSKRFSKSSLDALIEVEEAAGVPLPPSPPSAVNAKDQDDPAPPPPRPTSKPPIPAMYVQPPTPSQSIREPSPPRSPRGRPALHLKQVNDEIPRNKFIEIALSRTLELAWEMLCEHNYTDEGLMRGGDKLLTRLRGAGDGIIVIVLGDNDFYSQRAQLVKANLPPRIKSLKRLQPFISLPHPIHKTAKTGLGSSAALTTSFVAALLTHLDIVRLPMRPDHPEYSLGAMHSPLVNGSVDLVHSIAQLAHCLAQGKIGSGFDVASAVYGSHIYRRFSPSLLKPLMNVPVTPIDLIDGLLLHLDPERWNQQIIHARLPRGIRLLLADVDAGTDTPSFVSRVLKWKEEEPEHAQEYWHRLDNANAMLEEGIMDLRKLENQPNYDSYLKELSRYPIRIVCCPITPRLCSRKINRFDPIAKALTKIYSYLKVLRGYFRLLSDACGVPIEPVEQKRLLDACQLIPGVIGGGVPGAGGYDAIFLLIIDAPRVIAEVEDLWDDWAEMSVCPLSAHQSDGGIRLETIDGVRGLRKRLEQIIDGA